MANVTYYVALPILAGEDGELIAGEPVEAVNVWQAKSRAAGLAIGWRPEEASTALGLRAF